MTPTALLGIYVMFCQNFAEVDIAASLWDFIKRILNNSAHKNTLVHRVGTRY